MAPGTVDLDEVERLFLRGEFARCAALCRPALEALLDPAAAVTSQLELEPHSRQEVAPKHRVAAILAQCVFELEARRDADARADDVTLLERVLKQHGPLPFALVLTWLNCKTHWRQFEYAKEVLESLMGTFAERVRRGGVATPEMCAQYASLAYIYAVQVLPRLGELEGAQRFLAMHNNNVLLSREMRQHLLHALDEELAGDDAPSGAAGAGAGTDAGAGTGAAASSTSSSFVASSTSEPPPPINTARQTPAADKARKDRPAADARAADDAAIVLTKDQVAYLGAAIAGVAVLALQRKRITTVVSATASFFGDLLFSGT